MREFAFLVLSILIFGAFLSNDVTAIDEASYNIDLEIIGKYDFENKTLDEIIDNFRQEYGLNESNFSMSYETSDESLRYDYAENIFRTAASTYKLPLNMYYYDLEREGAISPNAKIGGWDLATIHYHSIVNSNNEMSEALFKRLGSVRHYHELMAQYCDQEYTRGYYYANDLNSAYMIPVLKRIYDNSENYEELLSYMKIASPGRYFKNNDDSVEIAHKYGSYGGAINDVGIIYADLPYFLSVYTEGAPNGELVLGKNSELMTSYTNFYNFNRARQLEISEMDAQEAMQIDELKKVIAQTKFDRRVIELESEKSAIKFRYIMMVVVVLVDILVFSIIHLCESKYRLLSGIY